MEPEITNVAECLVAMGAKISGIGTRTLTIEGVDELHGATDRGDPRPHRDRHLRHGGGDGRRRRAAASNARPEHLQAALDMLAASRRRTSRPKPTASASQRNGNGIQRGRCRDRSVPRLPDRSAGPVHGADDHVATAPRTIRETIFENRYMHVAELARFGADIKVDGQVATVHRRARRSRARR